MLQAFWNFHSECVKCQFFSIHWQSLIISKSHEWTYFSCHQAGVFLFCMWVFVCPGVCVHIPACVCVIHTFHRFKERSWWAYFYSYVVPLCLHTRHAPGRQSDGLNNLGWAGCTSQQASSKSQFLNKVSKTGRVMKSLLFQCFKLSFFWLLYKTGYLKIPCWALAYWQINW